MAKTRRTEEMLPPDVPTMDPQQELPETSARAKPHLNEAAEAIGGALGSAKRQMQNVRDRFTVIRGRAGQGGPSTTEQIRHMAQEKLQRAQEKAEGLKDLAGAAVEQARIQATTALEDVRARASRMAQNAKDSAVHRASLVRQRATHFCKRRPLAVIGIVGGAAFLLGIFLRVGRRNRG